MVNYDSLIESMLEKEKYFEGVSDKVWDYAELAYKETKSSHLHQQVLESEDFKVERGIGGIQTAFKGTFGSGKPVIGFLGEFDALPSLSQVSNLTEKKEISEGCCGHGCGHNLLGVGCLEAAVAVKDYIKNNNISGTVIYYGCPAEEGGSGKTFMVKNGCFVGCDIALSWHPSSAVVGSISTLASVSATFSFEGISSHAAVSPHLGRSALDSVELMNVGVNYLREHIIQDARIHYAITNSGGNAPNVVQSRAQVLYSIRTPKYEQMKELVERVHNVAKGAALMCGTTVTMSIDGSYADVIQNKTLDNLIFGHIQSHFPLNLTDEEKVYADKFYKVGNPIDYLEYQELSKKFFGEKGSHFFKGTMADVVLPPNPLKLGSTDVGDVSWSIPTAWFAGSTWTLGTTPHSWQASAQGKSSIAHKGMHGAAQVLAKTAIDLLLDPSLVENANQDFANELNGRKYETLV